jgi:hypothetical protein
LPELEGIALKIAKQGDGWIENAIAAVSVKNLGLCSSYRRCG